MSTDTELYKTLQLSNDDHFLSFIRLLRPQHVNGIAQKLIDDRLAKLGYQIEYGCCGTNKVLKLPRRTI